jgi:hypothetical protein
MNYTLNKILVGFFISQINVSAQIDSTVNITNDTLDLLQEISLEKSKKVDLGDLPFVFDDVMVVAGLNLSAVNFSNHWRDLSPVGGFHLGLESYIPVTDRAFFHYGVIYANRAFKHQNIAVTNHLIEVPVTFAYELPEFIAIDWRISLGMQYGRILNSSLSKNYEQSGSDDFFQYDPNVMFRNDLSYVFGLSAEYRNIYLRMRIVTGNFKVMPNDTGMMAGFYLDFGYFILREFRR